VRQVPGCGNVCPESAAFREDFAVQEGTVAGHFPLQVRSRVSAAFTALFTAIVPAPTTRSGGPRGIVW
jgi:hypothetical protein